MAADKDFSKVKESVYGRLDISKKAMDRIIFFISALLLAAIGAAFAGV